MLTSLLTAALSMMIGQAAKEREAMRKQTHAPAWTSLLIDILETDLRHAQWWAGSDDRLVLIGLGRNGLPAQIEYRWVESEQSSIWTRKQVPLVEGRSNQTAKDPRVLAVDMQGITIGPLGFGDRPSGAGVASETAAPTNRDLPTLLIAGQMVPLRPLPDRIAVQLHLQDLDEISPSREVILR